jgi:hypothetical protein
MNIASLLGSVQFMASTGPASLDDLMWLFAALGLSATAGLRAYLPLLAIGVAYYVNPQLLPLQSNFQLLHDPLVLGVLAVLVVVEFALDKVPGIDHLSDLIHTVIRPASGAIIAAGTHNTLSDINPWLAAGVGALLALSLHGVKATTRPVVTGTTVGHGNPLVSLGEDVVALGGTVLLLVLPVVGFVLLTILLLLMLRATRPLRRRLFGSRRAPLPDTPEGAASAAGGGSAAPASRARNRDRQLGGLIGRVSRRAAASAAVDGPPSVPGPGPVSAPMPAPVPVPVPAAPAYAPPVPVPAAPGFVPPVPIAPMGGSFATTQTAPPPLPVPGPAGGGDVTGDTTVQATNQAPYPPVAPNPVQPPAVQSPTPTTTQTYPQPYPTPSQPPWNYPGNAPTLPGKQEP